MALAVKKGNGAPEAVFSRALLAALPDGALTYSADGECRSANEAAAKLLRIPCERLLKQNFRQIRFWKASGLLDLAEETMRTGSPHRWDTAFASDPDKSLWLDFRLARVSLGGEATLLVVLADVSERKRAERALRMSEERYCGLADATSDLIFSFDRNLNLTGLNRAAARSLGLEMKEALGRHIADLGLPPETYRRWKRKCGEVLASGRPAERILNEFTLADGQAHLNETSLRPILALGGGVVGVHGVTRDITEHKQAEELVRDSEQRYHTLFSSANDGIILHDLAGRILEANGVVSERLGYGSEELLGMNVTDIRAPEASALYSEHMDEVRRQGRAVFETTHRRRDGSTVSVEVSSRLMEDAGRKVVLSISRDVTDRRREEEALRRTQFSVDHAADAMIWLDPEGRVLEVNESACRCLEYSRAELLAITIFDIDTVLAQAPERWPVQWQELNKRGSYTLESQHRAKSGHVFPVEVAVSHMEFAGKEYSCSFSRDISERKDAERRLGESEERFRTLVEEAPQGIFIQTQGRFAYANRAAERLFGASPSNPLVGQSVIDRFHPDYREQVRERVRLLNEERRAVSLVQGTLLGADENRVEVEVSAVPFSYGGENGALVFISDITERLEAEQALRERDDQLRQSQKMEAIGQLAGGIAHDFNNLLTAIIGYSELILGSSEGVGDSLRGDVEEIKTAADRASALTRQILTFSRRQALKPEVISLNEAVAGTERLLRRTLGEDIDLVTLLRPELGLVEVDASQFEQVLMNLALNSRDAMPNGGKLTIETANVELSDEYCRSHVGTTAGPYVMLAVSDTGAGMDEETRSRVFEPFFTTKEPGRGTGLGLSTVYGTVKQSGGNIFVYSEPGKGTTIKVYLPRADQLKKRRSTAVRAPGTVSGDETILVVEDERAVRDLTARILKRLGYEVIDTANGDDALALLEGCDRSVDMLLTDVVLPGTMQGNEVAQAVRLLYPRLPVLYMSGYTREAIVHAGRLDEGVNYLEKPFTPDGLAHRVREVLDCQFAVQ